MNDLSKSFEQAKQNDEVQKQKLKDEVYKDQNVVNRFIHEILWGSSKNDIFFDGKKDFNLSEKDCQLYYDQALKHIEEGTEWTQR
jgi:hypothetical protein